MGLVSRTYSYVDGTPARAEQANVNENTLYTVINGQLDWDNIKASLVNQADGLLKLDDSGKVPWTQISEVPMAKIPLLDLDKIPLLSLAKIPTPLTGKDADLWDGHHYGDTYNISAGKELQHNATVIVNTSGKVLHSVYM